MSLAPVVLFVYNRPDHTRRTLQALSENRLAAASTLHVFCDGPAADASAEAVGLVEQVRKVVRERPWCGTVVVHERDINLGLAPSIRTGVDTILDQHDRVIVLEDDIETSPGFLEYMNHALDAYDDRDQVLHVSGYLPRTSYQSLLPEIFLARHMSCWGWATWRKSWTQARWNAAELMEELDKSPGGRHGFDLGGAADFSRHLEANLKGELHTWAVFWAVSIYLADGLCLFPGRSLVRNTGTDRSGEHFRTDESHRYAVSLADSVAVTSLPNRESRRGRAYLRSFYRYGRDSSVSKRVRLSLGRVKHRLLG